MTSKNENLGKVNLNFEMDESDNITNLKKSELSVQVKSNDDTTSMLNITDDQFEDKEFSGNAVGIVVDNFWRTINTFLKNNKTACKYILMVSIALMYNAYLIGAIHYAISRQDSLNYCEDVGFLLIVTIIAYIGMFYFLLAKPMMKSTVGKKVIKSVIRPLKNMIDALTSFSWFSHSVYSAVFAVVIIFLLYDTHEEPRRLISALGIIILIGIGFLFSRHPGYVVWRHVAWGLLLQFVFGLLILRWSVGKAIFDCLGRKVDTFLGYTDAGSGFVFGYLVDQKPFLSFKLNGTANTVAEDVNSSGSLKFVFMFKVLSIIYFFNFMVSIFFYLGTMRWIVVKLGWLLQISVGTTACESMNAAGNIFLGQTEAPLMIKPYLNDMTKSELHAVMTGGFATIAGSVLAAYISFGISASHLLSASVMSAPAALAYAKLFYPETKKSKTTSNNLAFPQSEDANVLDAAANGASQSVFLVGNIAGSLIAFLAFVAFLNGLLGYFGGLVGVPFLSFEYILGWLFYPLAFIMGVPCGNKEENGEDECRLVAVLVGLKTIVNEFAAYDKLIGFKQLMSRRSIAIATYALCGFSNPASIGVQIAALSYMAPSRRGHISEVAFRAFFAGSAACFLTACIAGTLIVESQLYL